jgi:predicted metal-binding membrane protein
MARRKAQTYGFAISRETTAALLAWVGGAMTLVWMLAMTAFLSIERLLGVRVWLMRASGLALLGAAVLISVAA